jgi:pimeloyl-ACP methyl ester carboxylesterase/quercetin dioxygenase-like cupin family protein
MPRLIHLRFPFPCCLTLVVILLAISSNSPAHEPREHEVNFTCPVATIAGTLTLPGHAHLLPAAARPKITCVVIVGGTLSNTRDGAMARDSVPPRNALQGLAYELARQGHASLRFDKVGFGGSKPTKAWTGTYQHEAVVAAAAIQFAREREDVGQIVVAGESAGAYLACLAAKSGVHADAYIFLGGHCDSGSAIYEYNFARLAKLADSQPDWQTWAEKNARLELALGRHYLQMFEAAAKGQATYDIADGEFKRTISLARRKEELDFPPDEMFRHIKQPVLALSGELDLNVPPDHAARIVTILRNSGNHASTCVLIPGADHSFQLAPNDQEQRLKERYSFASFRRDYSPRLYQEIADWLDATLASKLTSKLPSDVKSARLPIRATEKPELDLATESTPARLHLAPGIQIINNITDKKQTTGVPTLEGQIGPLLLGENCQAHFIDMPAGMYCEEHPHSNESIIYTVRGKWVLCSKGRRHVMQPGTLFHFAPNTPTGYEVPFSEDAFILIFKGQRLTDNEADFIQYLKGLANRLQQERKAGIPYLLSDLPKDHPALRFAHEANPNFADVLKSTPDHSGSHAPR